MRGNTLTSIFHHTYKKDDIFHQFSYTNILQQNEIAKRKKKMTPIFLSLQNKMAKREKEKKNICLKLLKP